MSLELAMQSTRDNKTMCGIYGHFSRNISDSNLVKLMGASLVHRGPDGQSIHQEPHLTFGATRLAIIDLSAPPGVLFNENRTVAVAFNGEIYNHQALRAELEAKGHCFATRTDTEVLVHAYEEWNIGLLERLRGMFAFALWDGAQLLLARDRLGEKPLYYAEWDGDFYFASELKALLRSPKAQRCLNLQALMCYLTLGYAPPPLTPFEDIHKLGAGEYLLVTAQGLRKARYWQAKVDQAERRALPYPEAVRSVRKALEEAVANCLISDVPVGIFLSGGVDSSAIVALAARQLGARLHTFTVGYDFPEGSQNDLKFNVDVRYAQLIAQRYGTQHHVIRIPQDERLAQRLPYLVYSIDEPNVQPPMVQVAHVAALARQNGVPVMLSGEAADELFFGYEYYRLDHRLAQYLKVPALLRHHVLDRLLKRLPQRFSALQNLAKRAQLTDPVARYLTWTQLMAPERYSSLLRDQSAAQVQQQALYAMISQWLMAPRSDHFAERIAYADLNLNMAENLNMRLDKMSMAVSVEVRSPFQDYRLAELALSLPFSYKLSTQRTKIVLRDAVRDLLPEAILKRPKWGFFPPAAKWLRGALRPLLERFVSPSAVAKVGLFKPEAVQEIVEAHHTSQRYELWAIWGLLVFHIWHAIYVSGELTLESPLPAAQLLF
jgi:asparagine synthase (glutamine-hydrolysing)